MWRIVLVGTNLKSLAWLGETDYLSFHHCDRLIYRLRKFCCVTNFLWTDICRCQTICFYEMFETLSLQYSWDTNILNMSFPLLIFWHLLPQVSKAVMGQQQQITLEPKPLKSLITIKVKTAFQYNHSFGFQKPMKVKVVKWGWKSEMSIIWCISITNNVKSYKKLKKSWVAFLQVFLSINPSGRVNRGNFSFWE